METDWLIEEPTSNKNCRYRESAWNKGEYVQFCYRIPKYRQPCRKDICPLRVGRKLNYGKLDGVMRYRSDKLNCVIKYNKENKTDFKFISEFVHKLYTSGVQVSEIACVIEITESAIYMMLNKMGIDRKGTGGLNNRCHLTETEIKEIRSSTETYKARALKYKVSPPTISAIANKTGRWAD